MIDPVDIIGFNNCLKIQKRLKEKCTLLIEINYCPICVGKLGE